MTLITDQLLIGVGKIDPKVEINSFYFYNITEERK